MTSRLQSAAGIQVECGSEKAVEIINSMCPEGIATPWDPVMGGGGEKVWDTWTQL